MGVRRSPYLWRRELEEEPRESPPAHGAPQWQKPPQNLNVESQLWTALEHPHLRSRVGLWKGTPSKRMLSPQASPQGHTSRGPWAALTPQCPPGCQERPRRSLSTTPGLLERTLHKQEQPDTAVEASIFESTI
ncbi:hypothetical protein lerEdw1_008750 [Lerista edwardsae]|nr:hypothetical protein lerEdw1_008750 [Lerista edwardsae]